MRPRRDLCPASPANEASQHVTMASFPVPHGNRAWDTMLLAASSRTKATTRFASRKASTVAVVTLLESIDPIGQVRPCGTC